MLFEKFFKYIIVIVSVLFTSCDDGITSPDFDTHIQTLMEYYNIPGTAITTIKDYEIDRVEYYGVVNSSNDETVTDETLFQVASISKTITAFATLKLVQEGKIDLDGDIEDILISWNIPDYSNLSSNNVTIKQLLSHTAGISTHGFQGYNYNDRIPTLLQILNGDSPANSEPIRVIKTPGTEFSYSGGGYCIIQQALIDIEQEDFESILRNIVFEPLGMLNSTFLQPIDPNLFNSIAAGHYSDGTIVNGLHHIHPELAAAGLWSTSNDLAKFLIEIQLSYLDRSDLILNRESTELMLNPVLVDNYSLGVGIIDINGEIYFGHSGTNIGFQSFMISHMTSGNGCVVLTNSENGIDFCNAIFDYIGGVDKWPGYGM